MAISETLAAKLEGYRIGPRIRALRNAKDLTLVQLGERTGLSPGLLSKIERGQLVPTLPTLQRIALVFGVGLERFFEVEKRSVYAVVRRQDRLRLPDGPGKATPSYFFESLDFPVTDRRMEAYFAEFPAGPRPLRRTNTRASSSPTSCQAGWESRSGKRPPCGSNSANSVCFRSRQRPTSTSRTRPTALRRSSS